MDVASLYRSKLTTPDLAVSRIASHQNVSMGMATSEPPALLKALADRARAGELEDLRLYYFESMKHAAETVLHYDIIDRIKPVCMFMSGVERALIKKAQDDGGRKIIAYLPSNFHEASRLLCDNIGIDAFLTAVSPMDRHGYFSLGTGNDYSSRVARAAKQLVVEVNDQMPRVAGTGAEIHISEVTAIVENNLPLLELPVRQANDADNTIAEIISKMVEDGSCLQMGVGALPNVVCAKLTDRTDLGIHTEALCQGLVDLMMSGVVNNRKKSIDLGTSIYTFAMGQKAMYEFLHNNPGISSAPVEYVNTPSIISRNDKVVSINATLQIDLTGACNSEHMLGHQYTSSGGQLDFVRGAYASKGGKSIIACRSTAAHGKASRIVSRLEGPVTTPRIDTQWVVTEFGSVDLKGKSSPERAKALIELAHPEFRSGLYDAAREQHLL